MVGVRVYDVISYLFQSSVRANQLSISIALIYGDYVLDETINFGGDIIYVRLFKVTNSGTTYIDKYLCLQFECGQSKCTCADHSI